MAHEYPCIVAQRLPLLAHSKKALCSTPPSGRGLSLWTLRVLVCCRQVTDWWRVSYPISAGVNCSFSCINACLCFFFLPEWLRSWHRRNIHCIFESKSLKWDFKTLPLLCTKTKEKLRYFHHIPYINIRGWGDHACTHNLNIANIVILYCFFCYKTEEEMTEFSWP